MSQAEVWYSDGVKTVNSPDKFMSKEQLIEQFGHNVEVTLHIEKDKVVGLSPNRAKSHPAFKFIKKKTRKIKLY